MDGWNNGPQMPPFYGQQGNVQYTYAPVKKKKVWLWIVLTVILAAAAVMAAVLVFALPGGDAQMDYYMVPVFYEDGGDFYMTAGAESIELKDVQPLDSDDADINGMIDEKRNFLYYLADEKDGVGDMMRIKLGGSVSQPVKCVSGVCYAVCSRDGGRVLYMKDMDDGEGDLYLYPGEKIDESVMMGEMGFSKGGGCIYYITADKKERHTLYVKNGQSAPEQAAEASGSESFESVTVFDDGAVAYTLLDGDDKEVWRWDGGEAEKLSEGELADVIDSSRLLYTLDDSLYYWSESGGSEKVSGDFFDMYFAPPTGYYGDPRKSIEDRLVIAEKNGKGYRLLEYTAGGEAEEIADAASGYVIVGNTFNWVCYYDDEVRLAHKKAGKWESSTIEDEIKTGMFDTSGKFFYYISEDDDLMRIVLLSGEKDRMCKDVSTFWEIGGTLYPRTSDGDLYLVRPDGSSEKIAENAYHITETYGGAFYVVTYDEKYDAEYFLPGEDKGESVFKGVDSVFWPQRYIDWLP